MDTGASECAKVANSTNKVLIISRLTMPVAVSLLLMGCDTLQTESSSKANSFPSKSTAYERASAQPAPAASDDADTNTNGVQSVVTVTPKKPTPPAPQPAPVVVQQQPRPAVVPVASAAPVKASEKPVSKAPIQADKNAQKVASTAPVPSGPHAAPAQTASASASPVEALIVKGPPRPVKRPSQGVGKVVWIGLAVFGVAVLLLGTRVSVDNPRPAKVSTGGRRKKKSKVVDDDVVLPPELEMREPTGL